MEADQVINFAALFGADPFVVRTHQPAAMYAVAAGHYDTWVPSAGLDSPLELQTFAHYFYFDPASRSFHNDETDATVTDAQLGMADLPTAYIPFAVGIDAARQGINADPWMTWAVSHGTTTTPEGFSAAAHDILSYDLNGPQGIAGFINNYGPVIALAAAAIVAGPEVFAAMSSAAPTAAASATAAGLTDAGAWAATDAAMSAAYTGGGALTAGSIATTYAVDLSMPSLVSDALPSYLDPAAWQATDAAMSASYVAPTVTETLATTAQAAKVASNAKTAIDTLQSLAPSAATVKTAAGVASTALAVLQATTAHNNAKTAGATQGSFYNPAGTEANNYGIAANASGLIQQMLLPAALLGGILLYTRKPKGARHG